MWACFEVSPISLIFLAFLKWLLKHKSKSIETCSWSWGIFFHMILTNMSWFGKSILCEFTLSSIWNVLVRIGTKSRSNNMRLHYHDRNEIVNCASLFVCLFFLVCIYFTYIMYHYTNSYIQTILHLHYLQ